MNSKGTRNRRTNEFNKQQAIKLLARLELQHRTPTGDIYLHRLIPVPLLHLQLLLETRFAVHTIAAGDGRLAVEIVIAHLAFETTAMPVLVSHGHFPAIAGHGINRLSATFALVSKMSAKTRKAVRFPPSRHKNIKLRQVCIADGATKMTHVVCSTKFIHRITLQDHFITS